ncbi:MAG: translation initiation factor IF-3 [Candidatus Vogelbacteria bacterium]|nr:translation initiation factor IF-3 [Candidatus Vogelbacteria bacterium]
MTKRTRINQQITVPELRVITETGENLGVLSCGEALAKAGELGLDLIEVSPGATPPVAKIMDFGKYQYLENKKEKVAKLKGHTTETKTLQVKIGTGEHDLQLKATKATAFLGEGHRVKIDLFLPGRAKYLDQKFLAERLERFLRLIPADYKVADPAKKSPKGWTVVIEKGTAK